MLFDEKIAGNVHLALGAGYPESGSLTKSVIRWDKLVEMQDGGKIIANQETRRGISSLNQFIGLAIL
jgi:aminopeptidase